MSSSVALPLDLAKNLESFREQTLGMTQDELASSANVAQGTYSNLMLGKPVRAKSARAVVAAIQRAAEQYARVTNRTPDERTVLLYDVVRAVAVIEGKPDVGIPEVSDVGSGPISKAFVHAEPMTSSLSPNLHQPGGAVPSDAIPYITRAHDRRILETLQLDRFALLVRGPSQCGKSTALSLLQRRAHAIGIETAWFDPPPPPVDSSPRVKYDPEADADSTLAVSELLQARWGLQKPTRGPIYTIPKLTTWLLEELTPTAIKPRLLILDDLVTLGGPAAERWLSRFVRALVNQRATRTPPVNISIAVGLTEHYGAYFERKLMLLSSIVEWTPMLPLHWLNALEVSQLWEELRSNDATDIREESALSEVLATFKGQPYLTHAALIDKTFRDLVREWLQDRGTATAAAIRRVRWYRRHLSAIRLALCGPTYEPDDHARRVIKSFVELCTASPLPNGAQYIDPDHARFLTMARLVDDFHRPALGLYQLIAEDLQGRV